MRLLCGEMKFKGLLQHKKASFCSRKLFEWEERRGIAPESSTIALLNNPVDTREESSSKIINPAIGTLKREGIYPQRTSQNS